MATALIASDASSSTAAPMQVFALGWQKSGSTIMTTLLGHGLNVSYITEAVETCCCAGIECASTDDGSFARQQCTDQHRLMGPLWGGDIGRYAAACAAELAAPILKADDMIWQFDDLYRHVRSLPLSAPTAGIQFVFFVRHPFYNIRSLLAWCAPRPEECRGRVEHWRREGNNNRLFLRIYADQRDDSIAAEPVTLARAWKAAANVYLSDPSRFATVMRYEDMLKEPGQSAASTIEAAYASWYRRQAGMYPETHISWPRINQTAVRLIRKGLDRRPDDQEGTPHGDYDHTVGAASLFDENVTDAVMKICSEEMRLLGYTRWGVDAAWRPTLVKAKR